MRQRLNARNNLVLGGVKNETNNLLRIFLHPLWIWAETIMGIIRITDRVHTIKYGAAMNREMWLRHVAHIEVLIEEEGMYNTFGAILEALQNIEKERSIKIEDFEETQEYRNLQHCQQITEHVMSACDLDMIGGTEETRHLARERFMSGVKKLDEAML